MLSLRVHSHAEVSVFAFIVIAPRNVDSKSAGLHLGPTMDTVDTAHAMDDQYTCMPQMF